MEEKKEKKKFDSLDLLSVVADLACSAVILLFVVMATAMVLDMIFDM